MNECLFSITFSDVFDKCIAASYHQITRFIQGYVDNEINLNAEKSCWSSCADFRQTTNFGCQPNTVCAAQHIDSAATRCNGTIYNCEELDNDLTICPSYQKFQIRRYDFVRSAAGQTLGKNGPCLQTTNVSGKCFHLFRIMCPKSKPCFLSFTLDSQNRWPIFGAHISLQLWIAMNIRWKHGRVGSANAPIASAIVMRRVNCPIDTSGWFRCTCTKCVCVGVRVFVCICVCEFAEVFPAIYPYLIR